MITTTTQRYDIHFMCAVKEILYMSSVKVFPITNFTTISCGRIWTSTDGENWTEHRALPSNFLPSKIKYGNGNYIIMGTLNRYWFVNQFVAISKDGINWTDLKKVTDESINDFCFITE